MKITAMSYTGLDLFLNTKDPISYCREISLAIGYEDNRLVVTDNKFTFNPSKEGFTFSGYCKEGLFIIEQISCTGEFSENDFPVMLDFLKKNKATGNFAFAYNGGEFFDHIEFYNGRKTLEIRYVLNDIFKFKVQ